MTVSLEKQNFWQLASIFSAGFGLPAMIVGKQLTEKSGAGSSLISIVVGNIILWIISLGIISMAQNKVHAVKNVKIHIGKAAGNLMSFILVAAFLIWYAIQLQGTSNALMAVLPQYNIWQIGIPLGIVIAVLSMGGIQLIKWFCVSVLPLLVGFTIYMMTISGHAVSFQGSWGLSFSDVFIVILATLPGMVNLPTFFRHSKSKADSIIGISLIMVFHAFFQIFTIFTEIDAPSKFIAEMVLQNSSMGYLTCVVSFVLIGFICVNLINVYFASVAWETLILHECNSRGYMLIGLLGTMVFTFLAIPWSSAYIFDYMKFSQIMATSFIANIGVVLLISFVVESIIKHRKRYFVKLLNTSCWILGCIYSVITQVRNPLDSVAPVLSGVTVILVAFLVALFFEESFWAINQLDKKGNT